MTRLLAGALGNVPDGARSKGASIVPGLNAACVRIGWISPNGEAPTSPFGNPAPVGSVGARPIPHGADSNGLSAQLFRTVSPDVWQSAERIGSRAGGGTIRA